jgi:holo-[acyl-carrier protein] synthase
MILGIGVDLCPVDRLAQILERRGHLFVERVFTKNEDAYAGQGRNRAERLAARFAAKEAVIKAFGGAPSGLKWLDMEVVNRSNGAPMLVFKGAAQTHAETVGVTKSWLSLTHAGNAAVAMVVLEGENNVG